MADTQKPVSPWWRCSRYEIVDGRICPVRGSTVKEYDPWERFTDPVADVRSEPYLSLLNLLAELRERRPESRALSLELTKREEALITTWCSKYGLLGLLHHRTLAIWREPFDKRDGPLSMIDAVAWQRGGRWSTKRFASLEMSRTLPRDHAIRAEALMVHRLGEPLKPLTLESLRDSYFPRLQGSRSNSIPLPGEKDFWAEYSEPVSGFLGAVEYFRQAFQWSEAKPDSANEAMRDLLAGVSPIGVRREVEGVFSLEWSCPSLLGSLATMALLDHDQRQPAARCKADGCFRWFVPSRPRSATGKGSRDHCSETCRSTQETRRKRARAKSMASQPGGSVATVPPKKARTGDPRRDP